MSRTKNITTHSVDQDPRPSSWGEWRDRQRLQMALTSPSLLGAGAVPVFLGAAVTQDADASSPESVWELLGSIAGHMPGGWLGLTALAGASIGGLYLKMRAEVLQGPGASGGRASKREGFATKRELKDHLSFDAMYANIERLRPSLAGVPARQITPTELGTLVGRDIFYHRNVYSPCEELTLSVGPPRVGKSAHIGGTVLDAPGAVVATTTRGDLYEHTHEVRRARGPLAVFNDTRAGVPSSLRWNVVKGCRDPEIAIRRARNLLSASASGESMSNIAFFDDHACRLLRTLLMAADLVSGTLEHVQRWVTNPKSTAPVRILQEHHKDVPEGWAEAPEQALGTDPRLRDSVLMTLVRSFEFLASPEAAAMVLPTESDPEFNVEQFIKDRGTLYLIAEDKSRGGVGPLFSCLAGEIYEVGKEIAKRSPHGRLDPQLSFILDEAATICPLPLHLWTNDAGGNGVSFTIGIQNQSQLYQRWGQHGGANIWSNCNKMVYGGLSVREHLIEISELCGERDQQMTNVNTDKEGNKTPSVSTRRVPVMSTDAVRRIKAKQVLYIHKNLAPVLVSFTPVWKRPEVKAASKAAKTKDQAGQEALDGMGTATVYPPMPTGAPPIPSQSPTYPAAEPAAEEPGRRKSA